MTVLRRLPACLLLVLGIQLAAPSAALAQLSRYNTPVESAILETHVDLQLQFSQLGDTNVALLSVEGQIALGSVELALNVPFLTHGWETSGSGVTFGDIMAGVKWRVFGLGDKLGIAVFTNVYLPTHSGDYTREYTQIQGGAVASAQVMGFRVGGGLQTLWHIRGEGRADTGLLGFYTYGRFPILGLLAISAELEYFNSVHPGGDLNAFLITPSVELSLAMFHAGIGARIAVTDDARAVALGRVALIANAGFRF